MAPATAGITVAHIRVCAGVKHIAHDPAERICMFHDRVNYVQPDLAGTSLP